MELWYITTCNSNCTSFLNCTSCSKMQLYSLSLLSRFQNAFQLSLIRFLITLIWIMIKQEAFHCGIPYEILNGLADLDQKYCQILYIYVRVQLYTWIVYRILSYNSTQSSLRFSMHLDNLFLLNLACWLLFILSRVIHHLQQ